MTPSTEEAAALLALPAGAWLALAKGAGPGWLLLPGSVTLCDSPPANINGCAWLPADTAEILIASKARARALGAAFVGDLYLFEFGAVWCPELRFRLPTGETIAPRVNAATPRLAALRLLAAVWGPA